MKPAVLLTRWVKLKYEGNLIKRSGEPYFTHLAAVAKMAQFAACMGYETGLCHDLLEDTSTTENELLNALTSFGYTRSEAGYIANCVVELTDVFTPDVYPHLSKKKRKAKEGLRLTTISPEAQTIKYCDLIDNISWVMQYDKKHASKYLLKKQRLLSAMMNGDKELYQKALNKIKKGLDVLANSSHTSLQ
ncbi:hypothetical protein SNE25_19670 [Mucilaginibacter sabulilitoris]|uniref:HD domain-containing protein n=1 Tax=Mucilaginibacter sabulilitoris TaxID=1173583 RepID=A0ABZ0TEC0_9SPHI|nr:hypothetical protein [Mucilaginibacter sabulilitoris]WPU91541.1 hypothetical protein SNE25_19670 [Mucilaginibacter sabulilitoris]